MLRPDLLHKRADGTAVRGRVTYSNAQGEARGSDKKRVHDDMATSLPAGSIRSAAVASGVEHERPAKTARTDDAQPEEEEDDDDDGTSFFFCH